MDKTIIILTKSKKHSGYCVAGIDYETGEWIRLVSSDTETEGAVPKEHLELYDGEDLEIYDVIQCKLLRPCPTLVQPENWLYDETIKWRKIGESNIDEVLDIHGYDSPEYIFGDNQVSLPEDWRFEDGTSLCLVEVQNATIWVKTFDGNQTVSLNFTYNGVDYKYMKISQIDIKDSYKNMNDGSYRVKSNKIIFSLTDRYYYNGKYYKVVAQILD